jgi:hypothetical protein
MTNPRNFQPHPSLTRKRAVESLYRNRPASKRGNSTLWRVAVVLVIVMLGLYSLSYPLEHVAFTAPTPIGHADPATAQPALVSAQ